MESQSFRTEYHLKQVFFMISVLSSEGFIALNFWLPKKTKELNIDSTTLYKIHVILGNVQRYKK